jgi:hypothetical protein
MNANDAQIVRIYMREVNETTADNSLAVTQGNNNFDVVVEAEGGSVIGVGLAPYQLSLTAFDKTTGDLAQPAAAFTINAAEAFNPATFGTIGKWPNYESKFRVQLTQAQANALAGHVLQYSGSLISPPPGTGAANIVSFHDSEPFVLI